MFFGCHRHIREHAKTQKHSFSLELNYGQVHCILCNDYIYDSDLDKIAIENKILAGKCKKRLVFMVFFAIVLIKQIVLEDCLVGRHGS